MGAHWQKSEPSVRKSANGLPLDRRIASIASRQKQLIRVEQLRGLGLRDRASQQRAARGRLFRLHAGVYATHPPPFSRHQLYLAAVYACGDGASLIGLASAWLYDCVETPPLIAEVNSPTGRGRTRFGIRVRRRTIERRDLRTQHGIPTTTIARTILDCAAELGAEGTEAPRSSGARTSAACSASAASSGSRGR